MALYDTLCSLESAWRRLEGSQPAAPDFAASCRSVISHVECSAGESSVTASRVIKAILNVSLALNSLDVSSGQGLVYELVPALVDSVLLPIEDCMKASREFFATDPSQCCAQMVKDFHTKMRKFGIIARTERLWVKVFADNRLNNAKTAQSSSEVLNF